MLPLPTAFASGGQAHATMAPRQEIKGPLGVNKKCLAEAVRAACLKAAREGYALAAMSGLCHEGAVEVSLDAIRRLDLEAVLRASAPAPDEKP